MEEKTTQIKRLETDLEMASAAATKGGPTPEVLAKLREEQSAERDALAKQIETLKEVFSLIGIEVGAEQRMRVVCVGSGAVAAAARVGIANSSRRARLCEGRAGTRAVRDEEQIRRSMA